MRVLFRFLSRLPLPLLHVAGGVLGWMVFLVSGTYRQRFLHNTALAGLRTRQVVSAISAAGRQLSELPRLWLGSPVDWRWQGELHIRDALAKGQGIIFLTPHLGAFEVTAQAYAQTFGSQGAPITVLYRPPRKAWMRDLLQGQRERPGLHTAPTNSAGVKRLLRALRAAQCVGILPDQVPPQGQGVWAPFFGQPAYSMTLVARLAQQSGAPVLLAWGERLAWGRGYVVHVAPPLPPLPDTPEAAVAQLNQAMEQLILQAPEQYAWGYARYKAPPRTEEGS